MPIAPDTLSSFASDYAKDMTSIRGRRVQRLIKREFAHAECVLPANVRSGLPAALGLSPGNATLCATDGKGKQASVLKWPYGSSVATETFFDLGKDSLPTLRSRAVPVAEVRERLRLDVPTGHVPPQAQPCLAELRQALT